MNSNPSTPRVRRRRVLIGAVVGAVLAIGATSGTTSAWEPRKAPTQVVVGETQQTGGFTMMSRSGIRW